MSGKVMLAYSDKRVESRDMNALKFSNLQYACILIMAFLALPFLPALPAGRPAFLTPAVVAAALGVAVLDVAAAMLKKVCSW
jgi:hypothetical protein